jgi:hypothetical protein
MLAEALLERLFRFEQRPHTATLVADPQVDGLIAAARNAGRGRGAPACCQGQHQRQQQHDEP